MASKGKTFNLRRALSGGVKGGGEETSQKLRKLLSRGGSTTGRLSVTAHAEERLAGLDQAKINIFFQSQVRRALALADPQTPEFLESIKSFSSLGKFIFGFRWTSLSFHDEEEDVAGSSDDRQKLIRQCLRSVVNFVQLFHENQRESDRHAFVAISACLLILIEFACTATVVMLFIEKKWEASLFLSFLIAGRLYQVLTFKFLEPENVTCKSILSAIIGFNALDDAYRVAATMKKDYAGKFKITTGTASFLRQSGTFLIQYAPQVLSVNDGTSEPKVKARFANNKVMPANEPEDLHNHKLSQSTGDSGKIKHKDSTRITDQHIPSKLTEAEQKNTTTGVASQASSSVSKTTVPERADTRWISKTRKPGNDRTVSQLKRSFDNFVVKKKFASSTVYLEDFLMPEFIVEFVEKSHQALSLNQQEVLINEGMESDFVKNLYEDGATGQYDLERMPALMIGALLKYIRKDDDEKKTRSAVSKTLIAASFELADEVTDIAMVILFFSNPEDMKWAGNLMLAFMGTNRLASIWSSYNYGESWLSLIESAIGIKCITDTYRMLTQGQMARAGKTNLLITRMACLTIGIVFESLPQMILQLAIGMTEMKTGEFKGGLITAQILSVMASCISIAISFTGIGFDNCKSMRTLHPSATIWLPKDNSFRETILFMSAIVLCGLHLIIAATGISVLIAYADTSISLSILLVRNELWNIPNHSSPDWEIPELEGDHDANHAAHVKNYRACDLPWDKIERWLKHKKDEFWKDPPLWLTAKWFDYLTPEVKKAVWPNPGELEDYIERISNFHAVMNNSEKNT
eukprot:g1083.t1